jgi:hypothetical protein
MLESEIVEQVQGHCKRYRYGRRQGCVQQNPSQGETSKPLADRLDYFERVTQL